MMIPVRTHRIERKHWWGGGQDNEVDNFIAEETYEGHDEFASDLDVETTDDRVMFSITEMNPKEFIDAHTALSKEGAIELAHYLLRWATTRK
jgi:hypothetical protein